MSKSQNAEIRTFAQKIRDDLWVFPPDKDSNGTTSWWLDSSPEPVLLDCPPVNQKILETLQKLASGRDPLIILTNREGHGRIRQLQDALRWSVLVQEQEAYLLPKLPLLKSFRDEWVTSSGVQLLWTPGPTPGSCVAYAPAPSNVLFCGRLLIPLQTNQLIALRTKKTFHWTRQQKSLEKLRKWLPRDQRPLLASGVGLHGHADASLVKWEGWIDL